MEHAKILRINELARKKKEQGLTPAEVEEQAALRREYLQEFRKGIIVDGLALEFKLIGLWHGNVTEPYAVHGHGSAAAVAADSG